jgi:hypothetical protein
MLAYNKICNKTKSFEKRHIISGAWVRGLLWQIFKNKGLTTHIVSPLFFINITAKGHCPPPKVGVYNFDVYQIQLGLLCF